MVLTKELANTMATCEVLHGKPVNLLSVHDVHAYRLSINNERSWRSI